MVEHIHSLAISLIIGLLIGLERERSHPAGAKAMGVRTFILFALLGTMAQIINNPILASFITVFVFAAVLVAYWVSSKNYEHGIGITTEISAVLVYCLGFMVPSEPIVSSVLAGIVLLALLERKRLHEFSRYQLKPYEIEAVAILFIIIIGVLPFLPNRTIDPWSLFNPREFGILFCLIAGLQFIGYLSLRLFGHRFGMAMLGFFGGLISSTAVFANLPTLINTNSDKIYPAMAAGILATVAMFLEIMIVLFIASHQLFFSLFWPITGMMLVGVLLSTVFLFKYKNLYREEFNLPNPLDFRAIIRLTVLIGGILVLVNFARTFWGGKGIFLISFLGGLFEIRSVTLANSLLFLSKKLDLNVTVLCLYTGITATFVSKFFLLWTLTPKAFAWRMSAYLLILIITAVIVIEVKNIIA